MIKLLLGASKVLSSVYDHFGRWIGLCVSTLIVLNVPLNTITPQIKLCHLLLLKVEVRAERKKRLQLTPLDCCFLQYKISNYTSW